jgi:hypothetical protein
MNPFSAGRKGGRNFSSNCHCIDSTAKPMALRRLSIRVSAAPASPDGAAI